MTYRGGTCTTFPVNWGIMSLIEDSVIWDQGARVTIEPCESYESVADPSKAVASYS